MNTTKTNTTNKWLLVTTLRDAFFSWFFFPSDFDVFLPNTFFPNGFFPRFSYTMTLLLLVSVLASSAFLYSNKMKSNNRLHYYNTDGVMKTPSTHV